MASFCMFIGIVTLVGAPRPFDLSRYKDADGITQLPVQPHEQEVFILDVRTLEEVTASEKHRNNRATLFFFAATLLALTAYLLERGNSDTGKKTSGKD